MNNILDMEKYNKNLEKSRYNGRIDVLDPEDQNTRMQLFEKIAIQNKSTSYCDALNGVWEDNVLSQVYFSAGNIQIIQNGIRAGVYKMSSSKYNVPPQNIDALKIVMRSTYLQYAKHSDTNITKQVEELNELVLDIILNTKNPSFSYFFISS